MNAITRRDFLRYSGRLSALLGLGASAAPQVAQALEHLASGAAPVLWLQGQSCSGCSVSLLDSEAPTPAQLLTQYINLCFHQTLSTATGHVAVNTVNQTIAQGGYILCVEGAVPAGMPRACTFGEEPFGTQLLRAVKSAKAVVTIGTCACYGGIPAAENNPTGSVSVPEFLLSHGIQDVPVSIPGCPPHPDWILGTLVHVLKFGVPPLDHAGRPKAFFGRVLHDQCPRFADYERENYAHNLGDPGCLFKLGCLGPTTSADCTVRQWNGGVNSCIKSGAPCIGCASRDFAKRNAFPMLTRDVSGASGRS